MESAQLASEVVVQALARREGPSRERALEAYPRAVGELMGGYYRLGNVFAKLIGKPKIMHACTKYGLRINKLTSSKSELAGRVGLSMPQARVNDEVLGAAANDLGGDRDFALVAEHLRSRRSDMA